MNLDSHLNLALEAAQKASKAILKARENLEVWKKDDGSALSSADLASNEILCDILGKSEFKICSEESLLSSKEHKDLSSFWLIDPLDGTSGFLKNTCEFCIMIALISQNRPILALIKNPCNDDVFYAHKNTKVYKNDKPLDNDMQTFEANKFKALLSVNHLSLEDANFAKTKNLQALNIGSGLKFTALLEGKAGVYKRFERLNIWDLAAGDFLLNQNGGFMGDFESKMLSYSLLNFKSKPFIAVSHKSFLKDFL